MTDSNLDHLHPDLKPLAEKWLEEYQALGRKAKITITWRSPGDQQKAFDSGLSKAKPGQSKHEFMIDGKPASKAFDFALYNEDGDYISDGTDDWYADAGDIIKALKLVWGGDFKNFKDYDHAEMAS